MTLAEACKLAHFSTDQLEMMKAEYKFNSSQKKYIWHFPDGSMGFYNITTKIKDIDFIVIK
jgi:hypothetical protein